jgi:hypothetical protein
MLLSGGRSTLFAFSSKDEDLALPVSGRDPLGTQVVWQRRARDLVPALTAASREPAGFQLLLVAFAWWPEFATRFKRPPKDLRNYFLLVEQALARACKMCGHEWPLPGSRRLHDSSMQGVWFGLDARRDFLLDSPLANGTWGLYRGPAASAGLIGSSGELDPKRAAAVRDASEVLRRLFAEIAQALRDPNAQRVAFERKSPTVERLAQLIVDPPQKKDIRAALVRPKLTPLTGKLANLLSERDDEPLDDFVARARQALPEFAAVLRAVEDCERYLACMDVAFERLVAHPGLRRDELAVALKVNITALRASRARFRASGAYDGLAQQRHANLATAPLDSARALTDFLVAYHGEVSLARRTAPLVQWGDSGRLESVLAAGDTNADDEALDARTAWRNTYYLDALRHLALRTQKERR